jgi:hypothetical protein
MPAPTTAQSQLQLAAPSALRLPAVVRIAAGACMLLLMLFALGNSGRTRNPCHCSGCTAVKHNKLVKETAWYVKDAQA